MGFMEEAARAELAHRIKESVETKLADGTSRGTLCCLACGHDGQWSRHGSGWIFLREDCGLTAKGFVSPIKSHH